MYSIVRYSIAAVIVMISFTCCAQNDFEAQRATMVETQLVPRNIYDRSTLSAMSKVPRHEFVPADLRRYAYSDGPLSIGRGQTISQPFIVAYMTQALRLKPNSKVLEIGTGSGYQAAILAEIVDSVYTIEIVEQLALEARARLKRLGYNNVVLKTGDGYHGLMEKSPFDAIIVTAGAEEIPEPLLEQLTEGGRMIIPLGPHKGVRQLVQIDKKNGKIKKKNLMAVRFVPFTRSKPE